MSTNVDRGFLWVSVGSVVLVVVPLVLVGYLVFRCLVVLVSLKKQLIGVLAV